MESQELLSSSGLGHTDTKGHLVCSEGHTDGDIPSAATHHICVPLY